MRQAMLAALAMALCVTAGAEEVATTFSLCAWPTGEATASVVIGRSVDLAVQMETNDRVGGFVFDVALPTEGWTLEYHKMSEHGWYENDGTWAACVPQDADDPSVINSDTYAGDEDVPDFHISTACDPVGDTVRGTVTVLHFRLTVADTTPAGTYEIGLRNLEVGDAAGNLLTSVSAGPDLVLQVVDITDATLAEFLAAWKSFRESGTNPPWTDLDLDSDVDGTDADLVLRRYLTRPR